MAADAPSRIRVLVVDDEPLAREKIREMVKRDAEVEIVGECSSGAEAVEAVRETRPDLVLLDVQMPELGGFEVLQALVCRKARIRRRSETHGHAPEQSLMLAHVSRLDLVE